MPSNHNGGGDGEAAPATAPFTRATVLQTSLLSPTVRSLVLQLHDDNNNRFSYQAGQWVDFTSDDFAGVGGFSMCAAPTNDAFALRRELELAVKLSRHPASQWVHDSERCKPGASVCVRPGGKFTLALADGEQSALFVAGGIGVTALAAMVGELCERWKRRAEGDELKGPRRAAVLYSARTKEDFALLPRLRAWAEEAAAEAAAASGEEKGRRPTPPLTLQLHVTGGGDVDVEEDKEGSACRWRRGRILPADVRAAVDALSSASSAALSVGVFVCGPPQMTDELAAAAAASVGKERVFTERWW
jgi:ferredoxin-NADP reductase